MRHAKQAHTRIPVPARPGACQLTVRDLGVTLEGTEIFPLVLGMGAEV